MVWVSLYNVHKSYSKMTVCVQIFMKYGRQRWKLRGRIEINAKQVWDSEEMVFLPLISEFLSVKVSPSQDLLPNLSFPWSSLFFFLLSCDWSL